MDKKEFVEFLAEEVLLNVVGDKIEDIQQIPFLLEDIGYLEDKEEVISQINDCELHPESIEIIDFALAGEKILIHFEMPVLLTAFHHEEGHTEWLLRITATAVGKCTVPNVETFDWEDAFDEDTIEVTELSYIDQECDDLRVLSSGTEKSYME